MRDLHGPDTKYCWHVVMQTAGDVYLPAGDPIASCTWPVIDKMWKLPLYLQEDWRQCMRGIGIYPSNIDVTPVAIPCGAPSRKGRGQVEKRRGHPLGLQAPCVGPESKTILVVDVKQRERVIIIEKLDGCPEATWPLP